MPLKPKLMTQEEIEALIEATPELTAQATASLDVWAENTRSHWERLAETPHWKYREKKLPACQYFLRFDGNLIKKYDTIPKLIKSHLLSYPAVREVRMIFKPHGYSKFNSSIDVSALRRSIDAALETEFVDWRLRELYRFNNDGFHYVFTAGNQSSDNWVSYGIILIFTPFGVADI